MGELKKYPSRVPHSLGLVEKVSHLVIASDRRERGNLILHTAQRIEIATVACGNLAMTYPRVCEQTPCGGLSWRIR